MKKLKTLLWGIFQLVKMRLTKKKNRNLDEIVKKKFNFVGSAKRPHPGMKLFSFDPVTGEIEEVIIIKNEDGSNGFLNPDARHTWAINLKNAKRKFENLGL